MKKQTFVSLILLLTFGCIVSGVLIVRALQFDSVSQSSSIIK